MKNVVIPNKFSIIIFLTIVLTFTIIFIENTRFDLFNFFSDQPKSGAFNYPDSQCQDPSLENVVISVKRVIYIVKKGDNLWTVLDHNLNKQEQIRPLDIKDSPRVLNDIKDDMKKMSSEELKKIGISSGDASIISPGDRIDLSPVIVDVKKIYDETGINLLGQKISETYKKNNDYVCYQDKLMRGADAQTFIAFSDHQAIDKNNAYFTAIAFPNSDLDSFIFLDWNYSMDKNSVYYQRKRIEGVDAQSFQELGLGYFKDKNYVYYFDKKIPGIRPQNVLLVGNYLKSGDTFYSGDTMIDSTNADKHISDENSTISHYSYDGQHILYAHQFIVLNADPKSFQSFYGSDFAKDKNNVYCANRIIAGADVETFYLLDPKKPAYAEDKNNTYYGCTPSPR